MTTRGLFSRFTTRLVSSLVSTLILTLALLVFFALVINGGYHTLWRCRTTQRAIRLIGEWAAIIAASLILLATSL